PSLEKLKATHPQLYEVLKGKIGDYEYAWVKNLPSAGGLYTGESIIGPATAFVVDNDVRNILETYYASGEPEKRGAVRDFVYLLLVHEATELAVRNSDETITPDLESELHALIAKARAYYALTDAKRSALCVLLTELDQNEPDVSDRFMPVIETIEQFDHETIVTEKGIEALLDLIIQDPDYNKYFQTDSDSLAAVVKKLMPVIQAGESVPVPPNDLAHLDDENFIRAIVNERLLEFEEEFCYVKCSAEETRGITINVVPEDLPTVLKELVTKDEAQVGPTRYTIQWGEELHIKNTQGGEEDVLVSQILFHIIHGIREPYKLRKIRAQEWPPMSPEIAAVMDAYTNAANIKEQEDCIKKLDAICTYTEDWDDGVRRAREKVLLHQIKDALPLATYHREFNPTGMFQSAEVINPHPVQGAIQEIIDPIDREIERSNWEHQNYISRQTGGGHISSDEMWRLKEEYVRQKKLLSQGCIEIDDETYSFLTTVTEDGIYESYDGVWIGDEVPYVARNMGIDFKNFEEAKAFQDFVRNVFSQEEADALVVYSLVNEGEIVIGDVTGGNLEKFEREHYGVAFPKEKLSRVVQLLKAWKQASKKSSSDSTLVSSKLALKLGLSSDVGSIENIPVIYEQKQIELDEKITGVLEKALKEVRNTYFALALEFEEKGGHLLITGEENADNQNDGVLRVPIAILRAATEGDENTRHEAFALLKEKILAYGLWYESEQAHRVAQQVAVRLQEQLQEAQISDSADDAKIEAGSLVVFIQELYWHWLFKILPHITDKKAVITKAREFDFATRYGDIINHLDRDPEAYPKLTLLLTLEEFKRLEMEASFKEITSRILLLAEKDVEQVWSIVAEPFAVMKHYTDSQSFDNALMQNVHAAVNTVVYDEEEKLADEILHARELIEGFTQDRKLTVNIYVDEALRKSREYTFIKKIFDMERTQGININIDLTEEEINQAHLILAFDGTEGLEGDKVFFFSHNDFNTFITEIVFFNDFFPIFISQFLTETTMSSIDFNHFLGSWVERRGSGFSLNKTLYDHLQENITEELRHRVIAIAA
ncbi:MAG: hypothetical protein KKH94_10090, partial [Candidatus Omnitrophica bacterium]|nr:hypothetical protein [Candidatus Omnitrophota bacterium]